MSLFRHLHVKDNEEGNDLLKEVFTAQTNPLILVLDIGETEYYNKVQDKLEALSNPETNITQALFVWEGKYRSDVFELREQDITRIKKLLDN